MRSLIFLARLAVIIVCTVPPKQFAQDYYTRTASSPEQRQRKQPVIEYPGLTGSADIHVYPSPNNQSESSIAINWCNPINLLIGANVVGPSYAQGYYYSEDGGYSWDGEDELPDIGFYTSDPAVAFDGNNVGNPNGYSNGYFNYLEFVGLTYQLKVKKSTDGGATWSASVQIPSAGDADKNHMTSDPTGGLYANNLYVGYTDFAFFPGSPIKVSRSTNGGTSFTTPVNISLGTTSLFSQGANLAVGPTGDVYSVWAIYDDWDGGQTDEEAIGFAKSTNGGATWQSPVRILEIQGIRSWWTHKNSEGNPIRVNGFPVMAVDRSGGLFHGHIYVVWANKGAGSDLADIHMSKSTNGGTTWSAPIRVNNDNTTYDQWMPWITVSPLGRITVTFYDSRSDISPPVNQLTETWIAQSTNGGQTFENLRVGDVAFMPVAIPNTASGYMGDYLGVTSKAGAAYSCWADNRTGPYQLFVDIHDSYSADLLNVASWNRSPFALATAHGSGPKVIYAANKWHRVIHVNEQIAYSTSTDDGVSWTGHTLINGSAVGWLSNPSLHYSGNRLHVVFKTDNQVYYVRGVIGEGWEQPRLLATVSGTMSGITTAVDGSGICHVLYTSAASSPSGNTYVTYGTFNTGVSNPVLGAITNLASSYGALESPAIAVETNGTPHAVWTSNGEVLYRFKVGASWSAATNLSVTTTSSASPRISVAGGSVHSVWQEHLPGNREISYRSKPLGGIWGVVQNLSNNPTPSVEPGIAGLVNGEPLVVWADSTGTNYDVKYKLPVSGISGAFGATPSQSHYPVFGARAIANGSRVVLLCTDGSTSLYQIMSDKRDFTIVPKVSQGGESREAQNAESAVLALHNYPNPFNPTTVLRYVLLKDGRVSLKVFDIIGQEIAIVLEGFQRAGSYESVFDGGHLPSGIYLYRLQHNGKTVVGRMILSK